MDEALRVREFWFSKAWTGGALPTLGDATTRSQALTRRAALWCDSNPTSMHRRDELIRTEFSALVERAVRGDLAGWADSPRRRLSLIIVLDQFPRQIYRGTAQAFAYDTQALGLALSGMQSAADAALNVVERIFFYMPLQHAELPEVQEESVAAFKRLAEEAPAELRVTFESSLDSAQKHREVVRQFGRFPHRNAVLGRNSTPEEEVYLRDEPGHFGQ